MKSVNSTVTPVEFDDALSISVTPLWARIAGSLKARILEGEWASGAAIAPERALAQHYCVAIGTVRAAIQVLVDQGMLERAKGRGTYVRGALYGAFMTRFLRWDDDNAELPDSRIISRQVLPASSDVAGKLGLEKGAQVVHLSRQRSWKGMVRLLETIWLPEEKFRKLSALDPDRFPALLYPFYAVRCGVTVCRAIDDLSFTRLGRREAELLRLAEDHPALSVSRVAFDMADQPVEYRQALGNADEFQYRTETR
ncbi:GntR family transcriptional regulator [Cupriavidus basilensis OR16]|uniref:GntR family transcriptional regulator n=1 Tax=Cupriavidus basilensis OR16 TaxID=1127483 RepID=H1RZT6_9BURK|nr:GntR family transcriptional regulator [Cupriavidus basilensis]EHP44152.1 GntR family transcriptional regulator [Cupriavidus basilensis OR16]